MNTKNLCRNTVAIATVLLMIFTAAAPAINVAADRNTYEQTQNTESENPLSLSPEMISDALGGLGINDLLGQLGLGAAELRRTTPLKFACRCSPERAAAMLAALSAEERRGLPDKVDITCHMCGRTFSVGTGGADREAKS